MADRDFTGGLSSSSAQVAGVARPIVSFSGALVAGPPGFSCAFVPFFIHHSGTLRVLDATVSGVMSTIPIRPRPYFEMTFQRKGYKKPFMIKVRDI